VVNPTKKMPLQPTQSLDPSLTRRAKLPKSHLLPKYQRAGARKRMVHLAIAQRLAGSHLMTKFSSTLYLKSEEGRQTDSGFKPTSSPACTEALKASQSGSAVKTAGTA
jgi:hypothetical protein